jgi:hypothetical protein
MYSFLIEATLSGISLELMSHATISQERFPVKLEASA